MGALALMTLAGCGGDENTPDSSPQGCVEEGCAQKAQTPDDQNTSSIPPNRNPPPQKPDVLTISGSLNGRPELEVGEDSKRRITIIRTLASMDVRPSPDVNDNAELHNAATWRVIRPDPRGCVWDHFTSIATSLSRATLINVIGTDILPGTACHDWALAVANSGYRIEYTDVPYTLGGKASRVIVDIAPKSQP